MTPDTASTLAFTDTDVLSIIVLVLTVLRWPLRIVMIPIVIHRHRPSEALAWLAIVFFEPFVGLVIYMVMGRAPTSQRRIKRRRETVRAIRTPERVRAMSRFSFEPDDVERYHQDLVSFAEELTSMPVARGKRGAGHHVHAPARA